MADGGKEPPFEPVDLLKRRELLLAQALILDGGLELLLLGVPTIQELREQRAHGGQEILGLRVAFHYPGGKEFEHPPEALLTLNGHEQARSEPVGDGVRGPQESSLMGQILDP